MNKDEEHNFRPDVGYVPNAETATKIESSPCGVTRGLLLWLGRGGLGQPPAASEIY